MNFKDVIARDIHNVFLNTEEFASEYTVQYDGKTYAKVLASLQNQEAGEREQLTARGFGRGGSDGAPGLYRKSFVLYCAFSDLGGKEPKPGKTLLISDGSPLPRKFLIAAAGCEMGMLRLELEAVVE